LKVKNNHDFVDLATGMHIQKMDVAWVLGKWRTDKSCLAEIMWRSHPNNKDLFDAIFESTKNIGYRKLKCNIPSSNVLS
jgi:glutathionylspermidine synthase